MGKIDLHLSIDAELLSRAEAAGLDPAQALEEALASRLERGARDQGQTLHSEPEGPEARARRWADENVDAIQEHNARIAERGLVGADWRRW